MKIVILDGYTLNPGDLSWETLQTLGEVTIYDRTAPEQIVARAAGAEAVIVNKVVLNESTLARLPSLRYVGVMATGYNNIDVAAARKQNIVVTNAKAYSSASTAQHTFALLLALTNHAELHSQSARAGEWSQTPDFCYWKTPLVELAGKTMGLIGLGDIGAQVARLAKAFGMKVLVHRKNPAKTDDEDIELATVEEVFRQSDVVSLHCPLTDETKEIVNAQTLSLMKPNAFLLNTGRGGLVREQDLADALAAGTLAGAGLDVLSTEPPQADNPLLSAPNCLVTPHIAWATYESRRRLLQIVVDNIQAFQAGNPKNVVS